MSQTNPSISVYWLWLAVIAAVLANIPLIPFDPGKSPPCRLPITFLYTCTFPARDTGSWTNLGDNRWILLHAVVSTIAALVAMGVHKAWTLRCQDPWQDPSHCSRRRLAAIIVLLSTVLGVLAWCHVAYVLYFVVLIFFAGRFAAMFLIRSQPLPQSS
jgi:hypothetical protein